MKAQARLKPKPLPPLPPLALPPPPSDPEKEHARRPAMTPPAENAVVVAVKAEREISKAALEWALTHVVRPGDFVTLLAVIPPQSKGRRWRLWSFPKLSGDCGSDRGRSCGAGEDSRRGEVSASCSQMALQFHGGDQNEVNMRIKVVMSAEGGGGAVAVESRRVGANWVVIDRELKQETKQCMEELQCNIVLMKRNHAKVLRLNLGVLRNPNSNPINNLNSKVQHLPPLPPTTLQPESPPELEDRLKHSTPTSSPEPDNCHNKTSVNQVCHCSPTCSSTGASPFSIHKRNPLFENVKENSAKIDSDDVPLLPPNQHYLDCCNEFCDTHKNICEDVKVKQNFRTKHIANHSTDADSDLAIRTLQEKFAEADQEPSKAAWPENYPSHGRDAVSLFRASPSMPPPLCSVCRHKAPVFGKPPRWFTYGELEDATDQFSDDNFLAEGGFGWVYRGILNDGQVVAVKRLKGAGGSKGDEEFRAEVEALSRAQHRNVVMLIGYCVQGMERILVYEYICNGSLETHLYDHTMPPLEWHIRMKIANGTARGLRYLHEDCRVGFIHRDVRPNNILLTHDFEALVGDFGLARWQSEGSLSVDTRIVGTFGYLAPEYIETGLITEKADVYAFGVVLLELLTGRRAMDLTRPKGQQFLVEWVRPAITPSAEGGRPMAIDQFSDPRLNQNDARFFAHQLHAMAHAAALCLRRDPETRPNMSKVLRLLEGDDPADADFGVLSTPSTNGCISRPSPKKQTGPRGSQSQRFAQQSISNATLTDRNRAHIC